MWYFTLFWTLTMAVGAIAGMVNAGQVADRATTQAQKAGAALGATLGMGVIFVLWLVMLAAALILGLFLKKSSVVERGPTGPLAQATTVE
jgi:spore maturation protein SpmA